MFFFRTFFEAGYLGEYLAMKTQNMDAYALLACKGNPSRASLGMLGILALGVLLSLHACSSDKMEELATEAEPEKPEKPEKPEEPIELRTEGHLHLHLISHATILSPLNPSATLSVGVSGFANSADSDKVGLEISAFNLRTFLTPAPSSENTRNFEVHVEYDGISEFPEGLADIHFSLANIPEGYTGETQTLQLLVRDGLERASERIIPVDQDNLQAFNDYANGMEGLERHYQLAEDLRLATPPANQSNWTPIGTVDFPFSGSFDGAGHTLTGLSIDNPDSDLQGLFGHIGTRAVVENLGLEGGSVTGRDRIGSVVGWSEGLVENCYATGSVNGVYAGGVVGRSDGRVQNSHAAGAVYGSSEGGGVVGRNEGVVENCYATGDVRGGYAGGLVGVNWGTVQGSHSTGNINGGGYAGGVAGENNRTVRDSYSTGNISGVDAGGVVGLNIGLQSVVEDCHATGDIGSGSYVGGVVGANHGMVQRCYATGAIFGSVAVGGVVGLNGGIVQRCYVTGNVSGGQTIGGVVGMNGSDTVLRDCYATGDVGIGQTVGGVVGSGAHGTVENCYATGNVRGVYAVGGIAGGIGGVVQNCIALNPSVRQRANLSGVSVGRVAGDIYYGSLEMYNNHARLDMDIRFNTDTSDNGGTPKQPVIDDVSDLDGGSVDVASLSAAFWTQTMLWDATVWEMRTDGLPILRDVGGRQNP